MRLMAGAQVRGNAEIGDRVLVLPKTVYRAGPGPKNARKRRIADGDEGAGVLQEIALDGQRVKVLLDLAPSKPARTVDVDVERVRIVRGKSPRKVHT